MLWGAVTLELVMVKVMADVEAEQVLEGSESWQAEEEEEEAEVVSSRAAAEVRVARPRVVRVVRRVGRCILF